MVYYSVLLSMQYGTGSYADDDGARERRGHIIVRIY